MESSTLRFDHHAALQQADAILAAPPAKSHTRRPQRLQTLVFRAAIPSELCLAANESAGLTRAKKGRFVLANIHERLWVELSKQATPWLKYRWAWPLELRGGLPQVIACKFSHRAPDVGANVAKAAIDMLTMRKLLNRKKQRYSERRMGLIKDDRPEVCDQYHYWEFLPRAHHAFVLLEVRI